MPNSDQQLLQRIGALEAQVLQLQKNITGLSGKATSVAAQTATPPFAVSPSMPVPTGTGFRHITSSIEDNNAKLVKDADVDSSAAIAQSKVALDAHLTGIDQDLAQASKPTFAGLLSTDNMEVNVAGKGLILKSLAGARYLVTVANGGLVLTITAL